MKVYFRKEIGGPYLKLGKHYSCRWPVNTGVIFDTLLTPVSTGRGHG